MRANLSLVRTTKEAYPRLPFASLKEAVLGKSYHLSIAFVSAARSRALNRAYRGKDKPTNILSFSLSKNEGELIICLAKIKKETKLFSRTFPNLLAFLLIHGLFHLKGHDHGSTMERNEQRVRTRFKI